MHAIAALLPVTVLRPFGKFMLGVIDGEYGMKSGSLLIRAVHMCAGLD